MKPILTWCIMGIVCITLAAGDTFDLEEDFRDFNELIPYNELHKTVANHLKNDPGFVEAVRYLQGPEWAKLYNSLESKEEVADMISYITNTGLEVQPLTDKIKNYLHSLKLRPPTSAPKNLTSWVNDITKQIPQHQLLELFALRVSDSEDFRDFFFKMSDDSFKHMVQQVLELPETQRILAVLKEMGVDTMHYVEMASHLADWSKALLGMIENK